MHDASYDASSDAPSDAPSDVAVPVVPASYGCDPTAAPGSVRVHTNGGGVMVATHDVFGTYLGSGVSVGPQFGDGIADVMVPGCGAITVVRPNSGYATITYLAAGDELWPESPRTADHAATNTGPAEIYVDASYPGSNGSTLSGPVSASQIAVNHLSFEWRTSLSGTSDRLLVLPVDPSSGYPMGDAYALLPLPAAANPPALHVTSWTPSPPARHFTVKLPAVTTSGYEAMYASVQDGDPHRSSPVTSTVPTSNLVFDARAPEFGEGALLQLFFGIAHQHIYFAREFPLPMSSSVALDLSAELLQVVLSTSRSTDPRPTIEWTLSTAGVVPDNILVGLGSDQFVGWRILVPPGATSVRIPQLPANLTLTYNNTVPPRLTLFDASDVADYTHARTDPTRGTSAGSNYLVGGTVQTSTFQY